MPLWSLTWRTMWKHSSKWHVVMLDGSFSNQFAIMKKSCYAFPYVIARDLRILSKDSKTSRLNKP
jgi:hypothetical protein